MRSAVKRTALCLGLLWIAGCSNNPYPGDADSGDTTIYYFYTAPPKELDPQRSYTTTENMFLTLCYESLLRYDYLARPLKLVPELATEVPVATNDPDGKIRYSFPLQPGVHYIDDACFPDGKGRAMTARDFEFAFKRVADPETLCPVYSSFFHIDGFEAFRGKLRELRETHKEDKDLLDSELYAMAGDIPGVQVIDDHRIDVVLHQPYPQILYWLAMRFICAVPPEAVDHYRKTGEAEFDGYEPKVFSQRPVGTGPYRYDWDNYNKNSRIVMVANENWWGAMYPDRDSPAIRYPSEPGEPADEENGFWKPEWAGQPLRQANRLELYLEKEGLPAFNKFVQGYYDRSGIPKDNFGQAVQADDVSPAMAAKGIGLTKAPEANTYYVGFNMQDDLVGAPLKFKDPQLEANREAMLTRNRKLRQAMSLAFNSEEHIRIFRNGRGIPAQSLIPPGIFGYDEDYRNPYRQWDPELKRAKELLVEAGYPGGKDPATDKPLRVTYSTGDTSTESREIYNYWVGFWRAIGLDAQLEVVDYSEFQRKMHDGRFQVFSWGWFQDYPDPENFLFLLHGPNSGKYSSHNPNHTWYENPEYDRYFKAMETIDNDAVVDVPVVSNGVTNLVQMSRKEIIDKCEAILEEECPWIPTFHSVAYALTHEWTTQVKPQPLSGGYFHFYNVDPALRAARQKEWNKPIVWPLYVLILGMAVFIVPGVLTVRKSRR